MRASRIFRSATFGAGAVLAVFAFFFCLPLLWFILASLKTRAEASGNSFALPAEPQWGNFALAWEQASFATYLPNSIAYAVGIAIGVGVMSTLGGYALARINVRGEGLILGLTFALMIVPFQSTMIPVRTLVNELHLDGTWFALILPIVAREIPFGIFLMRGFFRGLPEELANAARVDGCGEWSVFRRIMLPLASPGWMTLLLLQAVFSWKLLLEPLVLVQSDSLRPVVTAIALFSGQHGSNIPLISAATLIASVPILIVALLMQRKLIQGVTAGALR